MGSLLILSALLFILMTNFCIFIVLGGGGGEAVFIVMICSVHVVSWDGADNGGLQ